MWIATPLSQETCTLYSSPVSRRFAKGACRKSIFQRQRQMALLIHRAVPFEVELTPEVVKQLQAQSLAHADQTHSIVSDLSYAGDEGGIVCHIVPLDKKEALFISITHVRMSRTMPLAAAVIDYQKHRVKKLRKQGCNLGRQ
jgi:hypothetical protein